MKQIIIFFKNYYSKIKIFIASYLTFSIFHKISIIFIPILTKNLVDDAVKGDNLNLLFADAIKFLIAVLLFILFLSFKYYFQNLIEINVINWLKLDMIKKINKIEYEYILNKELGYFTQRINKDIDKIKSLIISDYTTFFINLFYLITTIFIMFKLNIILTLILLLLVPIFLFFSKIFIPKLNNLNNEIMEKNESIDNIIEEAFNGNFTLRINNAITYIEEKMGKLLMQLNEILRKEVRVNIFYEFVLVTGIMNLSSLLIYCVGGYLVFRRKISAGTLVAFSLYFSRLWDPIEFFMDFPKKLKISLVSLNRIKELLEFSEEKVGEIEINEEFKHLTLNNVEFKYNNKIIFSNLNLKISKGDKIGIVGANGSGKSTLCYLLIKLIHPTRGEIYYNKISYKNINQYSLRKRIILIPSEPYIFQTTVFENISLINNTFNINEKVLKNLLEILRNNNIDFNSDLNNKGQNLSGGEKKIIQLARGLSRDADLYILDEPLNYIDSKYKRIIINFLLDYLKDKTFLIISHDKDIFEICNKIYYLENGILNDTNNT
ncbi:MAG: ABC transporter ATP-binding protein/permease [Caloramator sp.]|nr:ABC transporter ATP-binding protein/permease [Caloramator sp.]